MNASMLRCTVILNDSDEKNNGTVENAILAQPSVIYPRLFMWEIIRVIRSNYILVSHLSAGAFARSYAVFVMDVVLSVFNEIDAEDASGLGLNSTTIALLGSMTSVGSIIGMLLFGVVGDLISRRTGMIVTGSLMLVGTVLSACCFRSDHFPLIYQMIIYRTILGIGVGGEYPLSASMGSGGIPPCFRGRILAGVFAMQGLGMLFANLLGVIAVSSGGSLEFTWRFLLAFTVLPISIALIFRSRRKHNPDHSPQQRPTLSQIAPFKTLLFGTMLAWFFSDITFYGTGQFRHSVSNRLYPPSTSTTPQDVVLFDSIFGLIIAAIGLPGYILCVIFIETIGRWNLQFFGFIAVAVAYCALALCYQFSTPPGIDLALFGVTFFLINFGPNPLVFIIPSEVFPSHIRSTCNGISAAAGKVGATLGGAGFPLIIDSIDLFGIMYICGGVAFCGSLVTRLLIDRKIVNKAATSHT